MSQLINIVTLCAVFSDPSFYMSKSKTEKVCGLLPTVVEEANRNKIDPFLLMGLINVESYWNPRVVSSANACGLTQVVPKYTGWQPTDGRKYTCEQLKDPKTSIKVGAKILAWWIQKYGEGDIPTGLCGYFSGFRCKPNLNRAGDRYHKKVLTQKQKIEVIYSKIKNNK